MGSPIDISGIKYGMLTAVCRSVEKSRSGASMWVFRCDCGKEKIALPYPVKRGLIKSCGCIYRTHGMSNTRLYNIWVDMRQRCSNPNVSHYSSWGGKGITVCDEWRDNFSAFRDWAHSNGYSDSLSIDRINNDGNYCPENCRWATPSQQTRNSSTVREVTAAGKTQILSDWSVETGLSRTKIALRIDRYGYTPEQALELAPPPKSRTRKDWSNGKASAD